MWTVVDAKHSGGFHCHISSAQFHKWKASGRGSLAVAAHPPRSDDACELTVAVRQGTAMVRKIGNAKGTCLFNIAHFLDMPSG